MKFVKNAAPRALALAIACCLSQANAAPGDPIGSPYRVDPTLTSTHALPAIGMGESGIHTFAHVVERAGFNEIVARRRHHDVAEVAGDFTLAAGAVTLPAIAQSKYGISFVSWVESDSSGDGLFGRFISRLGEIGTVQAINTTTAGGQSNPAMATDGYGARYAIAFTSQEADGYGVRVRDWLSIDGANGDDRRVDGVGQPYPFRPDVAMNRFGHYAVAWRGPEAAGSFANHALVQVEFNASTVTPRAIVSSGSPTASVGQVAVAHDPSTEGFVVAWTEGRAIRARRLDQNGLPTGGAFLVDEDAAQVPAVVELGIAGDGAITFAWTAHVGGDTNLYVRHFDGFDQPRAAATAVGELAGADILSHGVGVDRDGDTVVTWTHQAADGAYASYAQRYEGATSVDLAIVAQAAPGQVDAGDWMTFAYDVQNVSPYGMAGEHVATGLTFAWPVPAGASIESIAGEGWQCAAAASVECSYEQILNPSSMAPTITIVARAPQVEAMLATSASVSSHQRDPDAANNVAASSVDVVVADTVPDAFAFATATNVAVGSVVTSDTITVQGVNRPVGITVSNGAYSVNGGSFTTSGSAVVPGDSIRVRHAAASTPATNVTSTLTIGGVAGTFTSRTVDVDTTPDAFAFVDRAAVATGASITSDPVTVAGINQRASIAVTGGSYSVNGGAFMTVASTVGAGDSLRVQHTSASTASAATHTTLTVGGVSDTFTSMTGTADTTPNAYTFADVTGARRGRAVDSNLVTITGYNGAVPISVTGGAMYSRNGGAFTSAPGSLLPGETLRLRVTASSTANTRVDVQVNVGGVSDTWSVTTGTK